MDQEEILQRTLQVKVIALSPQWVTRERKAASRWVHPIKTSALQLHCRCFRQRVERYMEQCLQLSTAQTCTQPDWKYWSGNINFKQNSQTWTAFRPQAGETLLSFGNQFLLGLDWDSCWVANKSRNFRESWKRPKLAKPRQDLLSYVVRRRWPTAQPCAAVNLRNTHALTNFQSKKLYCRVWTLKQSFKQVLFWKKLQYNLGHWYLRHIKIW